MEENDYFDDEPYNPEGYLDWLDWLDGLADVEDERKGTLVAGAEA